MVKILPDSHYEIMDIIASKLSLNGGKQNWTEDEIVYMKSTIAKLAVDLYHIKSGLVKVESE